MDLPGFSATTTAGCWPGCAGRCVANLTDRYYMDALTLGLMASPGRTVRLGFTVNF